jgi:hypothetical protein
MFRLIPLLLLCACDPAAVWAAGAAVQPNPQSTTPIDAARFADDLRAHLDGWYAAHQADVEAAGGATLAEAVLGVDASLVTPVLDPADDPFGDDLGATAVYTHPDVVFAGSDRVWFGAYRLSDGANLYVQDFE